MVEENGKRIVVELEMVSAWRFLIFSGEFGVLMRITQDRPNLKVCPRPPDPFERDLQNCPSGLCELCNQHTVAGATRPSGIPRHQRLQRCQAGRQG